MLKNSKGIKLCSFICYIVSLACLGLFIYDMVVLKGKYNDNLATLIGLGSGIITFGIIGMTLSPLKVFSRNNINFVIGIILCLFGGVTLFLCVYNSIKAYNVKMLLVCIAVILVSVSLGVYYLKVAKQDINIEARDKKESKEQEKESKAERKALTKCPYCGCRITDKDTTCPNCKSKL